MKNWLLPGADVDTSTLTLAGWLEEGEEEAYSIGDVMGVNCPCHDAAAEAVMTTSATAKAACRYRWPADRLHRKDARPGPVSRYRRRRK